MPGTTTSGSSSLSSESQERHQSDNHDDVVFAESNGSREYVDACLAIGVRVKMQIVQQFAQLSQEMPALLLEHYRLTVKDAISVTTAVSVCQQCSILCLSNNPTLQDAGVVAVCQVLVAGTNTSLETLQVQTRSASLPLIDKGP